MVAAPATAASTSSAEDMVSIQSRSAPPCGQGLRLLGEGGGRLVHGHRRRAARSARPWGPSSRRPATGRPAASATPRASRAAAALSSATRSWAWCSFSRCRVPPKLLVRMMSEPAATKPRCTAATRSGWRTFHSSGLSPVDEARGRTGRCPCRRRRAARAATPAAIPRSAMIRQRSPWHAGAADCPPRSSARSPAAARAAAAGSRAARACRHRASARFRCVVRRQPSHSRRAGVEPADADAG